MAETLKKRPYHSLTRLEKAEGTKRAICEAALELFRERGYSGTSIRAIAERAHVAEPTVYFAVKSKRGILAALIRQGLAELEEMETSPAEANPQRQIEKLVQLSADWSRSFADLAVVVRAEADNDRELAQAWKATEDRRLAVSHQFVETLSKRGRLNPALDDEQARDVLWMFLSVDIYRMLVTESGWSLDEYTTWLIQQLSETLLA